MLLNGTPGPEYTERLTKAFLLYEQFELGMTVDIVVSGGIHDGCLDKTLAQAGKDYLMTCGVPEERIIMHETLMSGNDEDFQAADVFAADKAYVGLHVVCSIGQVPRCWLAYITKGWQPMIHPVTYLGSDNDKHLYDTHRRPIVRKPWQSMVCELRLRKFGVAPFFAEEANAVEKATELTRQQHQEEIEKSTQV